MLTFDKPINLNGKELRDELNAAGVIISYEMGQLRDNGDNTILINIKEADQAIAAVVVAAHNGITVAPEPTIEDKLASVGLTLPDLKAALGL
jgi:hypothetical protein